MSALFLLTATREALAAIWAFQQPAEAVLAQYFQENRRLGSRDRTLLSDTVFGVLRRKRLLEFALAQAQPPHTSTAQFHHRLALLGLVWTASAASAPASTHSADALHHTLAQARQLASADDQPWLESIAQALAGLPCQQWPDSTRHNLPDWLASRLQQQYGDVAFQKLTAALQQPAPLDVRVNALQGKRAVAQQQLLEHGLESQPTPYSPWGLRLQGKPRLHQTPAFTEGLIEVQDEGSQLLCLLTDARRNETVVDFCAGAGGKTLALGAMMRNTGRLYALDISASRLQALKPRLLRSGLNHVHSMALSHEDDARLQRLWGKVDRVLVDAPCSGMGTLRRHPDLAWRQTEAGLASLQDTQQRVLASAARLLKPGGVLVYATCSLLHAENQAIADGWEQAQRAQPGAFQPLPLEPIWHKHKISGLLADPTAPHQLQLLPHQHGTDGFFAAAWQKPA